METVDDKTLATLLVVFELVNPDKTTDVEQVVSAYRRALDQVQQKRHKLRGLAPSIRTTGLYAFESLVQPDKREVRLEM